jgi:hypothetical protein
MEGRAVVASPMVIRCRLGERYIWRTGGEVNLIEASAREWHGRRIGDLQQRLVSYVTDAGIGRGAVRRG